MEEVFHTKVRIPKGIIVTEPDTTGPEIEQCACTNTPEDSDTTDTPENCNATDTSEGDDTANTSWCYLFIHNSKVGAFADRLERDKMCHFIHKTVVYQRSKNTRSIRSKEKSTISGLVFLKGSPSTLQNYLNEKHPGLHLVNNCSTHRPAVIADSIMQPFMRVAETSPERVRFLLHPFKYYAGGNVKLRLVSGFYAGLEGYVIRIDRDRRLVMDIGGMSVAISGIHCERFEVVKE